jgi:peroxiredoxin
MPLAPGANFPTVSLPTPQGGAAPLADAWAQGEALLLLGHSDCRTTRLALPCVDLIHRRRGAGTAVVAVLQDTADAALGLRDQLGLDLPLRLEADPYPLAAALGVTVVPTLFVVGRDGRIVQVAQAFDKQALEELAARFGAAPLFAPDDPRPAFRPG